MSICAKKVNHHILLGVKKLSNSLLPGVKSCPFRWDSLGSRREKLSKLHGETGVLEGVFMAVACFRGLKS